MSVVESTNVLCPEKPVFEKITNTQRYYFPLCGHRAFVLSTLALAMTIIVNIAIFCNDVNKTRPSVKLLAINILCYFVIKK